MCHSHATMEIGKLIPDASFDLCLHINAHYVVRRLLSMSKKCWEQSCTDERSNVFNFRAYVSIVFWYEKLENDILPCRYACCCGHHRQCVGQCWRQHISSVERGIEIVLQLTCISWPEIPVCVVHHAPAWSPYAKNDTLQFAFQFKNKTAFQI